MIYKITQLLFRAFERKAMAAQKVKDWRESEWFRFIKSWWVFVIVHDWEEFVLNRDSEDIEIEEFEEKLYEFLSLSFK